MFSHAFRFTSAKDVMLVTSEGAPLYADADYKNIFNELKIDYTEFKVEGRAKIMKGDPKGLLERVRNYVGFKKELAFLPVE